jgi:hypothetical protein
MRDIVERLRTRCISGSSAERDIVCEAADEIERLRGGGRDGMSDRITNHWEYGAALVRERQDLRAEIERLRAELNESEMISLNYRLRYGPLLSASREQFEADARAALDGEKK